MSAAFNLKNIVEAALLAAGRPLSLDTLQSLFSEIECPEKRDLRMVLDELAEDYRDRGIEITEVSSGWRIQVGQACSPWVSRLWDERPARYSRALMETLALIAYRQPITRGEIEDIRGVSVSTNIVKTLLEREWVRVVGQRDVPGKPSLYSTTREFLDYFGLKSLDELPTLAELRDLDEINRELDLMDPESAEKAPGQDEDETEWESAMPEHAESGVADAQLESGGADNANESPDDEVSDGQRSPPGAAGIRGDEPPITPSVTDAADDSTPVESTAEDAPAEYPEPIDESTATGSHDTANRSPEQT